VTDVFVSYRRAERQRMQVIEQRLKEAGLTVWLDSRLQVGGSEGFDAEIEREVSSASSVLVCWTNEALRSTWVRAEAMKGFERKCLVPVLLEQCSLPVPFNAVETVDLSGWAGETEDSRWKRIVTRIQSLREAAAADLTSRMSISAAAYEAVEHPVFPGTLTVLCKRIEALHPLDAERYGADIEALFSWLEAVFEKEVTYIEDGYNHAKSLSDGGVGWEVDAWRYWDSGRAQARAVAIGVLANRLERMKTVLERSKSCLELPSP
jgi:hypothetical protein